MSYFDLAGYLTYKYDNPNVAMIVCSFIQVVLLWMKFYEVKDLARHILATMVGIGFAKVYKEERRVGLILTTCFFAVGLYSRNLAVICIFATNFFIYDHCILKTTGSFI